MGATYKKYTSKKSIKETVTQSKYNDIKLAQDIISQGLTKEQRLALMTELREYQSGATEKQEVSKSKANTRERVSKLDIPQIDLSKLKMKIPKMSARGKALIMSLGLVFGGINIAGQVIKGANSKPEAKSKTEVIDYVIIGDDKSKEDKEFNSQIDSSMEKYSFIQDQIMDRADDSKGQNEYRDSFEENLDSHDYFASDIEKFKKYPGYAEHILALKKMHPNWNFEIYETGLDFNQCVKSECDGKGVAIQEGCWSKPWYSSKDVRIDGETWVLPSDDAVACMMDTRNFINENQIFQFESLEFSEDESVDTVKSMFKDVLWANSDKFTYTNVDGQSITLDESFSDIVYRLAKEKGISSSYLASKIILEQGIGASAGPTGCGMMKDYVGYYNYGNIQSYGKGDEIWRSGLEYAKEKEWTTPEKCIDALAEFIKNKYLDVGQNTIYRTKYNFDKDGNLYHQYMTNFTGAYTETKKISGDYKKMGLMEQSRRFIIPVYENMPDELSKMPGESKYIDDKDINSEVEVLKLEDNEREEER